MPKSVERYQDILSAGKSKFLFDPSSKQLVVGDPDSEQHTDLFSVLGSGADLTCLIAGVLAIMGDDVCVVANGSQSLSIPKGDPTPVAAMIMGLPGAEDKIVQGI